MKNKLTLRTLSGGHLWDDEREIKPIIEEKLEKMQMSRQAFEQIQAEFYEAGMMPPAPLNVNADMYFNDDDDSQDDGGGDPGGCDCKSKKIAPMVPVEFEN